MRASWIPVAGVFLAFLPSARADWVDLKSGVTLRGLDFKGVSAREAAAGKRALFTLETGDVIALDPADVAAVRKSPPGETVDLDGRQVTLREKVRAAKLAAEKRRKEAVRQLEAWARGGSEAEAARQAFAALPAAERERALAGALAKSPFKAARKLAATELSAHKSSGAVGSLAFAAVKDSSPAVRDASMASLNSLDDAGTGQWFTPFLRSSTPAHRIRAADGLTAFPHPGAVPVLFDTMRLVWDDFGRGFFFRGEDRAYISDYNLVSGGTGFSIVEVADPEVRSVRTGVILDVKVRKVEVEARLRALRRITGQDFGTDMKAWRAWWNENRGK
jgi:hypothetical protein